MYQPKVYRDSGGDRQVVAAGGILRMEPGSVIQYANPTGAADYYVDGNVSATGDGSIDSPYSTLAEAIAASNISIALAANRWWARRNRIFVMGDRLVEDLDTWPTKCDIVGVGSCDAMPKAGLRGNHVPTGEHYGTRWINFQFEPTTTAEDLFVLTDEGAGTEFHYCNFIGVWAAITVASAIDATAHAMLRVANCDFKGAFSANYIDFGPGDVSGTRILNNIMMGSALNGIMVTGATTTAGFSSLGVIDGNTIYCPGVTINDGDDDSFIITKNILISDAATGTDSLNIDTRWAGGNWYTDATKSGNYPVTA